MGPEAHSNTYIFNAGTVISCKSHLSGLAWKPNSAPGASWEVLSEAPIPHQDCGVEARDLEFLTCLYQLQRPTQYLEVYTTSDPVDFKTASSVPGYHCFNLKEARPYMLESKWFFRSSSIKEPSAEATRSGSPIHPQASSSYSVVFEPVGQKPGVSRCAAKS